MIEVFVNDEDGQFSYCCTMKIDYLQHYLVSVTDSEGDIRKTGEQSYEILAYDDTVVYSIHYVLIS